MKRCIFFLILTSTTVGAPDTWKDVYSESAWSTRDRWQKADELVRSLKLSTGSQVADVGCHEGYMTGQTLQHCRSEWKSLRRRC